MEKRSGGDKGATNYQNREEGKNEMSENYLHLETMPKESETTCGGGGRYMKIKKSK